MVHSMNKIAQDELDAVAWWLDESNVEARKQLTQHNPELAMWLNKIEALVNERLSQTEAEGMVTAKG